MGVRVEGVGLWLLDGEGDAAALASSVEVGVGGAVAGGGGQALRVGWGEVLLVVNFGWINEGG